MPLNEYEPGTAFPGVIGRTTDESSPAAITGRNHHANATAAINDLATGYPGYNGSIPFENGFPSEMVQQHGYSTYLVGKYHLMPSEFESAAGPFGRWPRLRALLRFPGRGHQPVVSRPDL